MQYLAFEVIAADKTAADGSVTGTTLGRMECKLSDIVLNRGAFTRTLDSKKGKGKSSITIVCDEASSAKGTAVLTLYGQRLGNARGCCSARSDTFYTLERATSAGGWVTIARSSPAENNLSPQWPTLRIPIRQLCNGDLSKAVRVQVLDWQRDDKHIPIGYVDVNARTLLSPGWSGKLSHPEGLRRDVGSVGVSTAVMFYEPSFAEYLAGGLRMSLSIAVDFTASNGNPKDPRSLHFASPDPTRPNPYEVAIHTIGDVMTSYDSSGGSFACYGYGGQLPTGTVSHCFALNGQPQSPECVGVEGVLTAYRKALANIALSGPTCFEPVVRAAVAQAETYTKLPPTEFRYHVLLIITDGAIMDIQPTVDMLVRGSRAPLSVIIMGVGDADFEAMEFLDAEKNKLKSSTGVLASRDIVNFVALQDFQNPASGARLAKEMLSELPDQVVAYYMANGRMPPAFVQKPPVELKGSSPAAEPPAPEEAPATPPLPVTESEMSDPPAEEEPASQD